MSVKGITLVWIVVNDVKKAIHFYTEIMGMKLLEFNEQFGWAELSGQEEGGALLGIAQKSELEHIKPGANAVLTMTVEDIHNSKSDLSSKGVKMIGDILEVPGVKMQMAIDLDGNHFQLVELAKLSV